MLDQPADDILARAAGAGDRDAFEQLLERHYDRIHRIGWRLLGNRSAAEDLAQEVAMALPRKLRHYRGDARFTTWLYRVVLNAGRDRMRANSRRARLTSDYTAHNDLELAAEANQAAALEWLREALGGLKPELRETAALILDEDLTHAQAAELLGVRESTVSWRLSEIRKALRQKVKTEQGSI